MKQITIRGVSDDLAKAIQRERKRRGTSLNQMLLDLLRQSLGVGQPKFDNGLSKLAGTWTAEEFEEFEHNTAAFEEIDQELWQ